MEYIIQEYTEKYGWCLYVLAGRNIDSANKRLEEMKAMNPGKQFRIKEVNNEDCWWNDPGLCN